MQPIQSIQTYRQSAGQSYTFSILIPTWNNLEYLKCCMKSIEKNSSFRHQLIVFVNEGADGTLEWIRQAASPDLDYLVSPENIGICFAVNLSRPLARSDYLVYMNDDMYVLPGWDEALMKKVDELDTKRFLISSTLIEPMSTGNSCVVVRDFGSDLESFREQSLLEGKEKLKVPDWQGSTWPPLVIHSETWDLVGGFSIEFSPGLYSDPDLSYKLLQAGVRHFMGVGSSLVYHFGSKSTSRIGGNRGRRIFLSKWGITARYFNRKFLHLGTPYSGPLPEPDLAVRRKFIPRMKRFFNGL